MSNRTIYLHKYSVTSSVSTSRILLGERVDSDPWMTNKIYAYVFDELGQEDHKNPRMRQLYSAILDRVHLSNRYKMHFSEKDDELDLNIRVRLEYFSGWKKHDGSDMGRFQERMIHESVKGSFYYTYWQASQNTRLTIGDNKNPFSKLTKIVFRDY